LKQYVVLDIETSGLEITSTINYIGIHTFTSEDDEGEYYIYNMKYKKEECLEHLRKLIGFIGHNAKFDSKLIKYHYGIDLKILHDSMYLCYMCSSVHDMIYKRGKWLGLKYAAMRDLGVENWDIDLKTKKSSNVDVGEYLKKDLYYTRRLFELYKKRIDPRDIPAYNLMIKAANVYRDVECYGIPIDLVQLDKTLSDYNIKLIEVDIKLKKYADINYNSPKQLIELLYKQLKLPIKVRSATGNPSTGVEALTELKGLHPIVELILEKRNIDKALTFLRDWKERAIDGRLYANFNLHTTVTGRTSSNGPNMQQVPRNKDLKSLFKGEDGWAFVQLDYSQMELRTAGIVAGVEAMITSYKNKEDLHTNMAANIAGIDIAEVTKEQRTSAKAANFGYLYGMQAKTFVRYAKIGYGVDMSELEAKKIRNTFFKNNHELIPYYKRVEKELVSNGFITNIFGRRYRVGHNHLYTPGDRSTYVRKGINFTVQSTASDYALMALIEIHYYYKNNPDIKIIGTVHDSILFEIRDNDKLYDYLRHIKSIMERPLLLDKYLKIGGRLKEFDIPIVADVEVGPWGKGEEIKL